MKTRMFVLYDPYFYKYDCGDNLTQVIVFKKKYPWEKIKEVIDNVNCDEDCDDKYDEIMYQLEQNFGAFEKIIIDNTDFIAEL